MAKKTSTPIDTEFQKFWDTYGLKRDRVAAERAWRKLSKGDRRAALAGIQRYRDDCEARGISRMYAQGYLNHRRWEDESPTPDPSPVGRGSLSPCPSPVERGEAKGPDLPLQGGQRGAEGQIGADLPDMAIW
jgi:hypothetical protein